MHDARRALSAIGLPGRYTRERGLEVLWRRRLALHLLQPSVTEAAQRAFTVAKQFNSDEHKYNEQYNHVAH